MEDKKNIAFFGIKYFPAKGGTSRVAENLIQNLANDYNVTIYCYKDKLAKTHKIDSFFFLKGLSKKAKVIATVHGVPYKDGIWGGLAKTFFKINEKRFLNFKGIKTAISKPLCEYYKEKYNVDVKFVPNGINLFEKSSENTMELFWPEKVPRDNSFVFFAARRIMGIKGLHTMLQAFQNINYKGDIFVAGGLDIDPAYIKQVKGLSKGLKVHFLGYVNPLSTLLEFVNRCEYFVFPSEIEGMSIMLLEVASTGKPIIASNIPQNTQVFDENDVIYFENKDANDLAEKLLWVESNKLESIALGQNAKKKVATKYTWDGITLQYISLYKSMLTTESA